jgi:hypothetical protein
MPASNQALAAAGAIKVSSSNLVSGRSDADRAPRLKAVVMSLTSMKRILLITILLFAPNTIGAQQSNSPFHGWDLTYKSLLNANHIATDEWIWKWLGPNYESPIKPLIATWKHEPIVSSVLVEMPAPHAGEHVTMWFVRTKTRGYYFEQVEQEDKPPHKTTEALNPQAYDRFFRVLSLWQQAKPVKPEATPEGGVPGYDGFLSLYNEGASRQMLLTIEDFAICNNKKCEDWKPGRLAQAMTLIPRFKVE